MSIEKQQAYENMDSAFQKGIFINADDETLLKYLTSLSNQNIVNSQLHHRDIIRGLTINHLILQRHIDKLNKQNAKTELWVIALAVAALISSIVQIFSPVLFQRQPIALVHPQVKQKLAIPSHALPPSSGLAIKKMP
jgi:hypothetical protein